MLLILDKAHEKSSARLDNSDHLLYYFFIAVYSYHGYLKANQIPSSDLNSAWNTDYIFSVLSCRVRDYRYIFIQMQFDFKWI